MVDLTWGEGWGAARREAMVSGVPYVHVEYSNLPFVKVKNYQFFGENVC